MTKVQGPILFCDDGSEIELPSKWAICGACEGHGTDRGASVECDGGGFTSSEWAEQDEDFRQDYLAGVYDRPCECCHGSGKILVADYDRMTAEEIAAFDKQCEEDREMRAIERAERRIGA